jgi:hypothetical protein
MPLQATSGAASYDAFGGGVPVVPAYIEDIFSCFLYTGNNSTQTITNGIDLSTKGGLVWTKSRNAISSTVNIDTTSGSLKYMGTAAGFGLQNNSSSQNITSFLTNGYSLGTDESGGYTLNASETTYVSWTFRKQPKFFDIQTWTGNGSAQTLNHNLGSAPSFIITKATSADDSWRVYHGSIGNEYTLALNSTTARVGPSAAHWNNTDPTTTQFTVGTNSSQSGETYIAYLFAHDAGGFGLTGTDNVISCGSYTGNGSATGPVVTLGYEPQWLMIKRAIGGTGSWQIIDNMRGMPVGSNDAALRPNLTNAEATVTFVDPTSTGFQITSTDSAVNTNTNTYIYIAIRRGPMKVPTSGTSVFGLSARTGTDVNATVTGGQTDDAVLIKNRVSTTSPLLSSRLTGTGYLVTSTAAAEATAGTTILQANPWDVMDGVKVGTTSGITNASNSTYINYLFKRAPSVLDIVCYTGAGNGTVITHNLGVEPEFSIFKSRSGTNTDFIVRAPGTGANRFLKLNTTDAQANATNVYSATATQITFTTAYASTASSGSTYIAYLFATCAGVSKVGSYTGTGALQTINCGFTSGARFVLIKRTDSTGDWWTYDSARGITSGNDPYWLTNSDNVEVTNTNYVDTDSTGFNVTAAAPVGLNASGGTYIFLAIA